MRDSERWYRKREGKNALCNWRKTQSWCFSKAEKCVSCKHFLPVIWVHNSFPEWWLWKNSPIGKVTFKEVAERLKNEYVPFSFSFQVTKLQKKNKICKFYFSFLRSNKYFWLPLPTEYIQSKYHNAIYHKMLIYK